VASWAAAGLACGQPATALRRAAAAAVPPAAAFQHSSSVTRSLLDNSNR